MRNIPGIAAIILFLVALLSPTATEAQSSEPALGEKYAGKPYYSAEAGFLSPLRTSAGTYLVFDTITENGDPIYIDTKTGERVYARDLDKLGVEPTGEVKADAGTIVLLSVILVVMMGFIYVILRS